jgi:beta-phosphoglucomutase
MGYSGFIFDLDGVIVDTAKYHYLAWRKTAQSLGFDLSLAQNENLKGVSRERSLRLILEWGQTQIDEDTFKTLMERKNTDYLAHIAQMGPEDVLPKVQETLLFLKGAGAKIALGSASKNARLILDKMKLRSLFDTIVDGNDVHTPKPDPEVFLTAAQQLGVPAEHCVVFEDAKAGVTAANSGGMYSVGIGKKEDLGHAHTVFRDFNEMPQVFLKGLMEA